MFVCFAHCGSRRVDIGALRGTETGEDQVSVAAADPKRGDTRHDNRLFGINRGEFINYFDRATRPVDQTIGRIKMQVGRNLAVFEAQHHFL